MGAGGTDRLARAMALWLARMRIAQHFEHRRHDFDPHEIRNADSYNAGGLIQWGGGPANIAEHSSCRLRAGAIAMAPLHAHLAATYGVE